MKKALSISFLLLFVTGLFAGDGIQFNQGSWKEILAQAKRENKLIFIDVYTSWCGPCKKMAAEVFPLKEVGNLFNTSFVNYKMNAEKGEGIALAKQFGVSAYPTYLFVNGDGALIYRTGSYMPGNAFLQEAAIALKEKDDPKPIVKWETEYNYGKRDKTFLLGYMKKRAMLKLPSAEIVEALFPLLTKDELQNKDILSTVLFFDTRTEYLPNGKAFAYVMSNYKMLDSMKRVRSPLAIMETGINNYFRKKIIENKEEAMLPVMISAYKQLLQASGVSPADILVMEKELPVKYCSATGDEAKLLQAATDYVENGILKLDIAGKQKADAEGYAKFIEPFRTGKADSTTDENFAITNRIIKTRQMSTVAIKLRDAAEAVYKSSSDKKSLMQATGWAKQAVEWFPHFSNQAVYAGLLFKTGRKEQGLRIMQTAMSDPILKSNASAEAILNRTYVQMQQGSVPERLWK